MFLGIFLTKRIAVYYFITLEEIVIFFTTETL